MYLLAEEARLTSAKSFHFREHSLYAKSIELPAVLIWEVHEWSAGHECIRQSVESARLRGCEVGAEMRTKRFPNFRLMQKFAKVFKPNNKAGTDTQMRIFTYPKLSAVAHSNSQPAFTSPLFRNIKLHQSGATMGPKCKTRAVFGCAK